MVLLYFVSQFIFIWFNLVNTEIDAYKILKNKHIAHGINGAAYISFSFLLYYFIRKPELNLHLFPYFDFCLFLFSSFLQRQLTFDIPLNLRRGKEWYYVSTDRPPKALFDRIEIRVFGYNGKLAVFVYLSLWLIISILKICISSL